MIEANKISQFEYLDGLRGSYCLAVLFYHASGYHSFIHNEFRFFAAIGPFYGVIGFFVLSSFLLTYRLLCDLTHESVNSMSKINVIIQKYFIRRFFRVYIPFFVYSFYYFIFVSEKNFLISTLTLEYAGETHLWTIAPEIKYYIFIPLFCLSFVIAFRQQKQYLPSLLLITYALLLFLIQYYNLFNISRNFFETPWLLHKRFSIFFSGSILAVIVFEIKQRKLLDYFIFNNSYFQIVIGLISLIVFVKLIKRCSPVYNFNLDGLDGAIYSTFYHCAVLFFLTIGGSNFFSNIFNSSLLKYSGKYSFGIYLSHMEGLKYSYRFFEKYSNIKLEIVINSCIACYFIGIIFFYLIEDPCIKLANKICRLKYFDQNKDKNIVIVV
jgi:peptidoglycan/LPS O-acetylase OafA/YrhL